MTTIAFWRSAAERSVKTMAQSLLSLWLVGDVLFNLLAVDWPLAGGVSLGAGVISLLTSIASAPVHGDGTPSLVGEGDHRPRHAV
ncbi:holin [Pseudonocardia asaccharolytica]|uniref:Holin n=1 Tax=Pseudonocardia asaccharolytica DSM 44247 = NBRC 16224 TaxID=1123024 RepID=A0A511D7T6_9PSEU|nr:holin [Pseudonocardia asaccharolytica]GEL20846.1 hypothetical protein PA7_46830 [Pseudonocardia asaccharolytica DSM 44247 = NBRC 16224]